MFTNKTPSYIIKELVSTQCVSPSDKNRIIPRLTISEDAAEIGETIQSYQKTGGEVYEALVEISQEYGVGFYVRINKKENKYIFGVISGEDRTKTVRFDTDLRQILTSEYTKISTDLKNVAYVQGQDDEETSKRYTTISGDNTLKGFNRRELYVDARDLSKKVDSEDGEQQTEMTDEEYDVLLSKRGDAKLSEYVITENFDMDINVMNTDYEYGKDYYIGDTVKIIDNELGLMVDAVLTGIEKTWDGETFSLKHTFGFKHMSLIRKVKRLIK